MKKVLKAVLALVVILIALVLLHPIWIGPVARTAVSILVPKFLGVSAKLDGFALNAYTGRLEIDGFSIDNPPACGTDKFLSFGSIRVGVNTLSLFSDMIVIDEISARDFFISFMTDPSNTYNFQIMGEYAGNGKKDKAEAESEQPEKQKEAEAKTAPKIVIDLIQIQNSLVKWQRASFPLPSFRLTGLGRTSGGLEFDDMRAEIRHKFFDQLGPVAQGLSTLLDVSNGTLGDGVKTLQDLSGRMKDVKGLEAASQTLDQGAKALKNGSKAMSDMTQSGTKTLNDSSAAVLEAAKSGTDALNSGAKALGEGAKALKSFFGK